MSITVPAAARGDYRLAKAYLSRDGSERRIFERLEDCKRRFHLALDRRSDDHFDPATDTIAWDPYSALRTTRGGRQTPALGLGHEAAHAIEDPALESRLDARADSRYDSAEERRVICGPERHAARTLGEAVRYDHRGSVYRVATPVSR